MQVWPIKPQVLVFELIHFHHALIKVARIAFVDITPIKPPASDDPTSIAEDRLHPATGMYHLWVDLLLTEVIEMDEVIGSKGMVNYILFPSK